MFVRSLFRKQLLHELGPQRAMLSSTLQSMLDVGSDEAMETEKTLFVLRKAANDLPADNSMRDYADIIRQHTDGCDIVLTADDIQLGARLGHGAFGVVYQGTLGAATPVALVGPETACAQWCCCCCCCWKCGRTPVVRDGATELAGARAVA